jgi:DNA/RNA-binding domain of Phe-tRNA-synthetase-like protein
MREAGISGRKFPSSIESLLRRAYKGGDPPHFNPLVDFYNAVSLRHVVPAGGFDLEEIDETLELRLTRAGDAFHPLDGSAAESVGEGEVAYASGAEILTRHFVYKQSRKALLTVSTTSLFLVGEVGGGVAPAQARIHGGHSALTNTTDLLDYISRRDRALRALISPHLHVQSRQTRYLFEGDRPCPGNYRKLSRSSAS